MWCSARPRASPPTSISRRLDGSNGFKLSGAAADDYSGVSVASAGDVNGDGFADLIVGARVPTRTARFRRELCGVRQGLGLRREHRSLDPRRRTASSSAARRPATQRQLGRLGRRRQRRRLRRSDRRRLGADPHGIDSGASYVVFGKARALPRPSISRRSTAPTASGSAARRRATSAAARSPRPATSTATASPT